ncbi:hypothetical protein FPJ27_15245 [Burkholderia sp. MS455]|uniref:hypothetical protein n=1 Tax=Burkholderia sp. MS455 TaxID=2811788 RepID=UPI0019587714|nr:hypothetical protein [Burkholderia sp. MS455]QRR07622.1 hypothetical protein FPJ27_15245 [Burkholderia sp. MS455]
MYHPKLPQTQPARRRRDAEERDQADSSSLPGTNFPLLNLDDLYFDQVTPLENSDANSGQHASSASWTQFNEQEFQRQMRSLAADETQHSSHQQYHWPTLPDFPSTDRNQTFARWAFAMVRSRFKTSGIKSGNKRRQGDISSIQRAQRAYPIICDIQQTQIARTQRAMQNGPVLVDYTEAMERGAGNCGEMSGAAAQMINRSGGYAEQYQVDDLGTHGFTLVGRPPATARDHVRFSDYEDCWVVDPWAGIVCEARNYCDDFELKMHLWAQQNKHIRTRDAQWVPANDSAWIRAVTNNPKSVRVRQSWFDLGVARQRFPGHID